MSLKAASHVIVVQPSIVDGNEHRTESGLFVAGEPHHSPIYRGVILDIGAHIDEPNASIGGVVHYSSFAPLGVGDETLHIVTCQHVLGFEDES